MASRIEGAVNVGEVVRATHASMQQVVGDGIAIDVEIGPELPDSLLDPGRLELALLDLAARARDAMPEGGRLGVRVSHVVMAGSDYVSMTVLDTGIGMSRHATRGVVERCSTNRRDGTGLELAAVRSFVADARGLISVSSRPHVGTLVAMFFPTVSRRERPTLRAIPWRPPRDPA